MGWFKFDVVNAYESYMYYIADFPMDFINLQPDLALTAIGNCH